MASVKIDLKGLASVKKEIDRLKKAPQKVLDDTARDFRDRMPGWIADEVTKIYGVKKSEIMDGTLGQIKVSGNGMESSIKFSGRRLTPAHFGMTPTEPRKTYTLKASILKGEKKVLGKVKKMTKKQRAALAKNFTRSGTQSSQQSPIMLMHTGNTREGGINYIPFQRESPNRKDIHPVKTVSLPQMVSHDGHTLKPEIAAAVWPKLEKRLDHYVERHMKK